MGHDLSETECTVDIAESELFHLREQTALLNTLLNSISQGVIMFGKDGRISAFNSRACELLKLSQTYLATCPRITDVSRIQFERGDLGENASLVEPGARDFVVSMATEPAPPQYLRTTKDGRVIEIKTQLLPLGGGVKTYTDVTDYVQAQQAQRHSATLLAATQSMAQIGGWEFDPQSNEVLWTDEVYRMLETSPNRLLPTRENVRQFFPAASLARVGEAVQAVLKGGPGQDLEFEMLTAKRHRIWVHAKITASMQEGGRRKCVAMMRNITGQKSSQEALQASEAKFVEVASQIPGVVFRVHAKPDGTRTYSFISDGIRQLFQITPQEVMAEGSLLLSFLHPSENKRARLEMDLVLREDIRVETEYQVLLRDGSTKWIQMTSAMESRTPEEVIRNGVLLDITAKKKAEIALRERDELWKLAMESTGDGVWDWNLETDVEVFSKRIFEMYGFTENELENSCTSLDRLVHPDDIEQMRRDRQAHFDGLTPAYVNEHRMRCKDGSWKWVLSRGMIINRDAQGRPLRMTGTHSDITDRKNAEALIWQQANFDALTGLPNRRMLRDRLTQAIKRSQRESLSLAVLFIDLDHFKEINDTLGHDQGDALLVQAALRICQCVRDADTVARMGGDEFTVVLEGLHDNLRVDQITATLIQRLQMPFQLKDELVYVSASIGITLFPDDASDIDALFKNADQAMYVAKGAGRNRFSHFTPSLQTAAQHRARMIHDLRLAIQAGQFSMAYQPVVCLETGVVHKAEALIRWHHPTKGVIAPDEFITAAETSGLIIEIGEWVFRTAADQAKAWRSAGNPDFQVSINKSPAQFHVMQLDQAAWLDYLVELGLPGSAVVVEITEGMLLEQSPQIHAHLMRLKEAGVGVSLDDFGTGYSSLSYLQQYDIDYLKIDQSFVRGLAPGVKALALCKAIISMAHALGIKVIAEGVETTEQRDLLIEAGCDYGQGYLFARAMPPREFEATYLQR